MDLDDVEWTRLKGGYRLPYDPRNALRALESNEDTARAWSELWNELHHQGDVGEASYAAVPHLVRIHVARNIADWNTYALITTIESARRSARNPDIPANLEGAYEAAWRGLMDLGLQELGKTEDPTCISSIIAVLAIGKRQFNLGRFAVLFSEEE
jgi:hypothetical protein